MSKSSNSAVPIIAGSLAVTGALAAASMWRKNNTRSNTRDRSSASEQDVDQKDDILAKFFCHDLPTHIIGDQQVVRRRSSADLLADLVGNLEVEKKGTPTKNRQGKNYFIEAFFNHCYVANKGDNSVSSQQTNDTDSVSSNSSNSVSFESTEEMVAEESSSNRALVNNDESESIAEEMTKDEQTSQVEKTINYEWDDDEYVAPQKGPEETPVSGADAAALFLAGALIVAQSFV